MFGKIDFIIRQIKPVLNSKGRQKLFCQKVTRRFTFIYRLNAEVRWLDDFSIIASEPGIVPEPMILQMSWDD